MRNPNGRITGGLWRATIGSSLLFTSLLCACSTISTRQSLPSFPFPPAKKPEDVSGRDPIRSDGQLEKRFLANPTEPMRLLVRYQQARLWSPIDPAKACALWLEIQGHAKFPLQPLARLRALETCPVDRGGFASTDELLENVTEPWLQEPLRRAALQRAERSGDKTWEMRLSLDVAKMEKLQKEKVRRLQRAVELATELGDQAVSMSALEALREIAPRFIESPEPSKWHDVAMDLRQVRDFDKSREWYQKIVESPDTEQHDDWDKLRALDGIRMTYKLEKNSDAYIKATQAYADFARSKFFVPAKERMSGKRESSVSASATNALLSRYFQTQLTLARAIWTENDAKGALALLEKVEKEIGGRISVDESVLLRARIAEEAGEFENAVKILDKVRIDKVADRDFRLKLLWHRAWYLRKVRRFDEAIPFFERLAREEPSANNLARNRFWLGRTFKDKGLVDRANEQFENLIVSDPLGWYGLLAYRELKRTIPALNPGAELRAPAAEPPELTSQESALPPEERLLVEWLIATGENDVGRRFLDFATRDRRARFDEAKSLDLLRLYARTGSYQTLFSRLFELPVAMRTRLIETYPDLLFPAPWKNTVDAAAKRFKVQPELIYAIMRQESSFNPTARSHADAFGLMQLIPEMAKKASAQSGVKLGHHEDLYLPEVNIQLGASFIHGLLTHWRGGFVPAVASYNASEKAISGWLKTRFRGDPLEFIEDVPYEETRNYIKLVTRNFVFYSRLNSGGASIEFPEWCLASLQDIKP